MEQKSKAAKMIIPTIFLAIFLLHSCSSVQSRFLPPSPSPATGKEESIPKAIGRYRGRFHEEVKRGSFPATCHSKCYKCNPCMPVEVSIRGVDQLQESQYYYPLVWRCACRGNIFTP